MVQSVQGSPKLISVLSSYSNTIATIMGATHFCVLSNLDGWMAVSLRHKLTKGQTAGIVQPKLSHPLHVILVPPLGLRWKNYRKRSSAIHGVDTRHKNELTRHFGVYWWLLVVVLAAAAGTFSNRQDPITVESDKGKWELIWRVFVQMEFGYESDLLSEKWQKSFT